MFCIFSTFQPPTPTPNPQPTPNPPSPATQDTSNAIRQMHSKRRPQGASSPPVAASRLRFSCNLGIGKIQSFKDVFKGPLAYEKVGSEMSLI